MQLSELASILLVVFYVIASLVLVGLVGFAAWMVWKLHNILEKYEARINPVIEKADQVLTVISEKVDTIGGKAENILTQGEEMAESVHEKVDRTATTVQRTINAPIIKANSWAAALTQGLSTFTRLQQQTDKKNGQSAMEIEETAVPPNKTIDLPREVAETKIEIQDTDRQPARSAVVVIQDEEQSSLVLGRKG